MLIKETGFFCFTKHIFSFSWRAQLGWISQEHGIIFKIAETRGERSSARRVATKIHRVPEQLTRFAALGGHENRGVAAHEITAQLARCRVEALEQYHWNSYAFFAGTRAALAWLCTESILEFFGRGSQCELQNAFRQQWREAAAIGR
jgi:hypothetical protein